jgi:chromosome segregation ATPase
MQNIRHIKLETNDALDTHLTGFTIPSLILELQKLKSKVDDIENKHFLGFFSSSTEIKKHDLSSFLDYGIKLLRLKEEYKDPSAEIHLLLKTINAIISHFAEDDKSFENLSTKNYAQLAQSMKEFNATYEKKRYAKQYAYENHITQLQNDAHELEDEIKKAQKKNKKTKKQLERATHTLLGQLKTSQQRNKTLTSRVNALEEELKSLKQENEKLKKRLTQSEGKVIIVKEEITHKKFVAITTNQSIPGSNMNCYGAFFKTKVIEEQPSPLLIENYFNNT